MEVRWNGDGRQTYVKRTLDECRTEVEQKSDVMTEQQNYLQL
jgi:hypothetical protein